MKWPKQFDNLDDPRFATMYLEQMPCTAKRHGEAIARLSDWLDKSVAAQGANDRMREITARAKAAINKHSSCKAVHPMANKIIVQR